MLVFFSCGTLLRRCQLHNDLKAAAIKHLWLLCSQRTLFCLLAWRSWAMLPIGTSRLAQPDLTALSLAAYTGKDPIKEHLWQCVDSDDTACTEAFAQVDPTEDFCNLPETSWRWTHPQESVRSDFGLFCDTAWLLDLSNSFFFLGFLVGAAGWGIASDSAGRFSSLIGACLLSGIFTALTAAVSDYHWFVILRILSGALRPASPLQLPLPSPHMPTSAARASSAHHRTAIGMHSQTRPR